MAGWFGQGLGLVAGMVVTLAITQGSADAARAKHQVQVSRSIAAIHAGSRARHYASRNRAASRYGSPLQCVPFARENSGIELTGNAGTWWNSATGLYERGARPEVGSILNFRATSQMRLGHVAVVTNVISSRHIEIDHANWGAPGKISRDIDVVDVSQDNDWTAVRVALGHMDEYGSVYPTFGFIYDRPDTGTMIANNGAMPAPTLNAAPSDLRSAQERIDMATAATAPEEVAEAPADDDSGRAPHSYNRRHATQGVKSVASRTHRRSAVSVGPSTYRVSTHGAVAGRPHRTTRRRF